jgi:hypothetical protein
LKFALAHGQALGLEWAGFKCLAHVEIERNGLPNAEDQPPEMECAGERYQRFFQQKSLMASIWLPAEFQRPPFSRAGKHRVPMMIATGFREALRDC